MCRVVNMSACVFAACDWIARRWQQGKCGCASLPCRVTSILFQNMKALCKTSHLVVEVGLQQDWMREILLVGV